MKRNSQIYFAAVLVCIVALSLHADVRGKALLIGVSDYGGAWPTLRADEDVALVRAALAADYEVTVVPNPNKAELRAALDEFADAAEATPEARLLVYFAGHGATLDDIGYIVPRDAPRPGDDPESKRAFKRKAIAMDDLVAWAKPRSASQVLFVFDSCFSGSVLQAARGYEIRRKPSLLVSPVRAFFSSGSAGETVPDMSVFRKRFIDGINGAADLYPDCVITSDELSYWIGREFAGDPDRRQTPQYGKLASGRFTTQG
ncbi:MAG: hypothetical protein QOH21_3677, partial [Acidobacteriota bacterium]|nr:hypothetical protein [Acidobacteriota bacterium]